jgi:hypothetical protein
MMPALFKKRRDTKIRSKYYLFLQDKWAKKMSALTAGLSKGRLVLLLVLFVVFSGTACLYNFSRGFFNTVSLSRSIELMPIGFSKNRILLPRKPEQTATVLSKKEDENINSFSMYLDSLRKSPEGKRVYDSINYSRPGLLDSLYYVENYYQTKSKN